MLACPYKIACEMSLFIKVFCFHGNIMRGHVHTRFLISLLIFSQFELLKRVQLLCQLRKKLLPDLQFLCTLSIRLFITNVSHKCRSEYFNSSFLNFFFRSTHEINCLFVCGSNTKYVTFSKKHEFIE